MKSELVCNKTDKIKTIFDQRALQYAKENKKNNKHHDQSYILFKLKNECFGVSIHDCQRVLTYQKVTPIPFSKSYIKGILHYYGRLISTVDLLHFFGYAETIISPDQPVIVIKNNNVLFAILADQIMGINHYSENELSSALSDEFTKNKKYVLGIQNGNIAIINTEIIKNELISSQSGDHYEKK